MRFFLKFSVIGLFFLPALVSAQQVYAPLVNINGGDEAMTFEAYISFLYGMSISVAALLAVVKIIIAGAKYMLSDVINTKSDAISDIQGAVLGLLLIISAVIILELINPKLTNNNIEFKPFQSIRPKQETITAAGQNTADFEKAMTANYAACMKFEKGPSGPRASFTADATGCSEAEQKKQLENFETNCRRQAGTAVRDKADSNKITCSVLTKDGLTNINGENVILKTKKWGPDEVPSTDIISALSSDYISRDGRYVVYDAASACDGGIDGLVIDPRSSLDLEFDGVISSDTCKEVVREKFSDYCANNAGKTINRLEKPTCQLPEKTFDNDQIEELFKKQNPNSAFSVYTFKRYCEETIGGTLRDTSKYLSTEENDYACVID